METNKPVHELTIPDQYAYWRGIQTELTIWLHKTPIDNPEWEQKNSERNAATWKIKQLSDRQTRRIKNIADTYSFPNY